jgi:hypothetical protein
VRLPGAADFALGRLLRHQRLNGFLQVGAAKAFADREQSGFPRLAQF